MFYLEVKGSSFSQKKNKNGLFKTVDCWINILKNRINFFGLNNRFIIVFSERSHPTIPKQKVQTIIPIKLFVVMVVSDRSI